jgi:hypothetical protein
MKMTAGLDSSRVRSATIVGSLLFILVGCSGTRELTEMERQKLDPPLIMLLRGDSASGSDLEIGLRSKDVEEIKQAGIQIGSSFNDVITARVSILELRKILGLASVRAVQASSKNRPQ